MEVLLHSRWEQLAEFGEDVLIHTDNSQVVPERLR